jgi:hypothetical protein
MHPCVYGELNSSNANDMLRTGLEKEIALLMTGCDSRKIVDSFMSRLPEIRRMVETDIDAAYEGDPAATSRMEVVMAYPGLYAVTVHRLAHELY